MRTTARRTSRLAAAALATALSATGTLAAASAAPPSRASAAPAAQGLSLQAGTADSRIASKLAARATPARFGSSFAGTVVDAASNQVVWSKRGNSPYIPASNAKLFTAAAALTALGPDARFTTMVKRGATVERVVLVGNGDPLLTSAHLDAMAKTTAAYLKQRGVTAPRVYVDDDYFPSPSLAYGWKSSYVPDEVTPVRALVRDNLDLDDTSRDAGIYFRARLRAHGLAGAGYFGRANASTSASTIARAQGVTVSAMVSRLLLTSDNDVSEILLRKASSTMGNGRAWAGARTTQTESAAEQGLNPGLLYDGSGLSRANRVSTTQLAQLLRRAVDPANPELATMQSASTMPTAGRTGSLKSRFLTSPSKCAAGKVWAKTGTLNDVVALSGWTVGTDGRVKVFSFLVNNRKSTTTLKRDIDMLAATVNGCY